MPIVAIAFDRKPCLTAFNHEVNPLGCDFILGKHGETLTEEFQCNVDLEPAFEWLRRLDDMAVVLRSPPFKFIQIDSSDHSWPRTLKELK